MTHISLGQATYEGDAHLFIESTFCMFSQNQDYKRIIEKLEEHVITLTTYIQPSLEINTVPPPPPHEDIYPFSSFDLGMINNAYGHKI